MFNAIVARSIGHGLGLFNVSKLKHFSAKSMSSFATEDVSTENKNQVLWVKFNRPKKLNAITHEMYEKITHTLETANNDESIKTVVLTGVGDYYSSGNDLGNFMKSAQHPDGLAAGLRVSLDVLIRFVDSFINLEKFLIAAVNGPAVGIPVTTLGLCDYVISSSKATFSSPFTALGQCAEGCSSYTLPKIMGPSRASELLLLNKVLTAQEACQYGLVARTIESDKFQEALEELLHGKRGIIQSCYPQALKIGKSLIRNSEIKSSLHQVNRAEAELLYKCWLGEECQDAVAKFMQRSKK